MAPGHKITKETVHNDSFLILLLHTLYPTLNRSIRSRVEGYRGLVNRYLIETPLSSNPKDCKPYLRILSVATSFPTHGIDPPLGFSRLLQFQQYLLSMQQYSDPFIEYSVALGVYGFHRQLEDRDVHIQAIYHSPDLFITLRSSLNQTLFHLNISCKLDSHPIPLSFDESRYHSTVLLEEGDHSLHVIVSKHSSTVLQEETIILSSSSPAMVTWQAIVVTLVIGSLLILLLSKWKLV